MPRVKALILKRIGAQEQKLKEVFPRSQGMEKRYITASLVPASIFCRLDERLIALGDNRTCTCKILKISRCFACLFTNIPAQRLGTSRFDSRAGDLKRVCDALTPAPNHQCDCGLRS